MKRKLALTAVLAVALAVTGYAQKPDFSGVWTPDAAAAAASAGRRRWRRWRRRHGGGGPMTVKQTATRSSSSAPMGENKVDHDLQARRHRVGQQARWAAAARVETKSTAKWDGSKLTIVTKHAGAGRQRA